MSENKTNRGTKMRSFGSSKRESHDSTEFYTRKLYKGLNNEIEFDLEENFVPREKLNGIFCKSSEHMEEIPDNSVHLMVTSPPYCTGKEYDDDLPLLEYLALLEKVWSEVHRVLVPGGRACINVANLGRKPYIPLHSYIINSMIEIGYLMRGEIIWDKSASAGSSTAWGSWQSASNPVLRDVHEYILIFSKASFKRFGAKNRENTISKEDFLQNSKSIWKFQTVSAKNLGHPAPFPIELPYRLIQLYSFKDDIILDPFIGSGQTAIAALMSQRKFIGYEINSEYIKLAENRIKTYLTDHDEI